MLTLFVNRNYTYAANNNNVTLATSLFAAWNNLQLNSATSSLLNIQQQHLQSDNVICFILRITCVPMKM